MFKYFNFINDSIYELFSRLNIRWELSNLNLLLPVGISFYTFQTVGYVIDVYRGDIKAEKNLGIFALYVSFFPQLVAGPIERAKNLLPQFKVDRRLKFENVSEGLKSILWGFFMKVVVADRLAIYVDAIYDNVEYHSGISLVVATIFFAFQIYCDFAGYSLIAIGCAKILGIDLMVNFNRPYFSKTISSFWKRWHISLSSWFRDYLYIPLGGNRVSPIRNYINIGIVFLVSGLWHGANWTFFIWGGLHGIFLMIERIITLRFKNNSFVSKNKLPDLFKTLFTFIIVSFAWIFFRANSLQESMLILRKIATNFNGDLFINYEVFFGAAIGLTTLVLKEVFDEYSKNRIGLLNSKNIILRFGTYLILVFAILLLGVFNSNQFIYFQF